MNKTVQALLITLMVFSMIFVVAGCNGEEEYQIETDQEFQEEVDNAVESAYRGETTESTIIEELTEEYSDRYSEDEIREYVGEQMDQEENEIFNTLDEIEARVDELENKGIQNIDKLEEVADVSTMEEVEAKISNLEEEIVTIDGKLQQTEDLYQMIELLEEMEEIMEEMVKVTEEALQEYNNEWVAKDLESYYQEIEPLSEKELAVLINVDQYINNDYSDIDDEIFYDELVDTLLPATEFLLEELKKEEPHTEEVQQLHQLLLKGWSTVEEAFLVYLDSMEEKDNQHAQKLFEQGNERLNQGIAILENYNRKLRKMAENYQVDLDLFEKENQQIHP